jgi:uncharacterized protein YdeI (YjbR/CyaY-like superfamily)
VPRPGGDPGPVKAVYFPGPGELRRWLEREGATARELLVGFHKVGTGKPSPTWPEAVDEALCVGWIDGVRRSVDAGRYTIRFTPRRPASTWSAVNIARARELIRLGRMRPAGRAAFEARADERSAIYSYEQRRTAALSPEQARRLRADRGAAAWLAAQAPWYRRAAAHWVTSAKKEETRERRFAVLLACCAAGRRIPPLLVARADRP